MRPMLLSHINDLVGEERSFRYSFEIYEVLIEKWIERESNKQAVREKYGRGNYEKLLSEFTQKLATDLYENKEKRGGFMIGRDETIGTELELGEVGSYERFENDLRGKSLLNRNANGQLKFAHKSILEFFLAKKFFQDIEFFLSFDFEGMNGARKFHNEMLSKSFLELGSVYVIGKQTVEPQRPLENTADLTNFEGLKIAGLCDFNILLIAHLTNLSELVIYDKDRHRILYDLYGHYLQWNVFKDSESQKISNRLKDLGKLVLLDHLKDLAKQDVREKLKREWDRFEILEEPEERQRISEDLNRLSYERNELVARLELFDLHMDLKFVTTVGRVEQLKRMRAILEGNIDDDDLSAQLEPVEKFLADVKRLQERLPKCKIYY